MTAKDLNAALVRDWLPPRPLDAHKGTSGHVLIVAGSRGMAGAAVLAGLAALRAGAGLVTVASTEAVLHGVAMQVPEALTLPLDATAEGTISAEAAAPVERYMADRHVDVLAMGPGLSQHPATRAFTDRLLQSWTGRLVLDADGLNNTTLDRLPRHGRVVVTPHPGEFAKLFGVDRDAIARDREGAAERAAQSARAICVLKGHRTVIADAHRTFANPTGNPAMATGGMGDVLTGTLAAFAAQRDDSPAALFEAACSAVYVHGLAADLAAVSDRGLLASEVAHSLPKAMHKIGVRR